MVRVVLVTVLVASTIVFAVGRDDKGQATGRPRADGDYYYVYLPSLWLDRDLDFRDEYQETGNWYRLGTAPTGHPANVFGIGPAVFETPFFLAGHAAARVTGARDDGFSEAERLLTAWASVLASVLAVWFAWRVAERRLGAPGASLVAVLLVFVGGPVFYYGTRQPAYAHPFATLFAAWLIDAWDRSHDAPRTVRTWLGLGALLGCAMLARPQLVTWALPLVVTGVADLWRAEGARSRLRVAGRLAAGAAAALLCFAPQILAWRAIYGAAYVVPQGEHFMRWDDPAWSEVLFSSRNGLLPWAPLYAIAAIGLVVGARRYPRLCAILLLEVVAQAIVNGAVWDWWAGGSVGGRRFDSVYIAFAVGLAFLVVPAVEAVRSAARHARPMIRATAASLLLTACGLLALATLWLSMSYTSRSARIQGGRAAAEVYRSRVPWPLGAIGAGGSSLTNLPARAAFAWRHQTSLAAYDEIVGVHWLFETYPGLNSRRPALTDERTIDAIPRALRRGFTRRSGAGEKGMVLATGEGRVFVGLNVRGDVTIAVKAANAAGGAFRIDWDGDVAANAPLTDAWATAQVTVARPSRGTHELTITAPPGTIVLSVRVTTASLIE